MSAVVVGMEGEVVDWAVAEAEGWAEAEVLRAVYRPC